MMLSDALPSCLKAPSSCAPAGNADRRV